MSFLKRYFMLSLAAAALIGMAALGLVKTLAAKKDAAAAAQAGGPASPGAPTLVAQTEAGYRRFATRVEALGTAQARESIVLSAVQTETIAKIHFESGQYVQKGAPLIELAATEEAANLLDAQAALVNAQRDYDRYTALAQRGIAAQARADEAKAALDRAEAQVLAIKARQEDRIMRAPFSGVVGLRDTSPGALARPGDALATLDDLSVIKVDFNVPERFLASVKVGVPISAHSDAFPGAQFSGKIAFVDSRIDSATRSLRARAELPNPKGALKPGMLLIVDVEFGDRQALAVPEAALTLDGDKAYVLTLESREGALKALRRDVVAGDRRDGFVEIVSGLKEGEAFVAEGGNRVRPGETVRVQSPAAPPPAAPAALEAHASGPNSGRGS